MATRPAPNAHGEFGDGSYMEDFLRRLDSNDLEAATAAEGKSMESLDASASSPNSSANPWQYLSSSDPSSPIMHRDFYNLSHSPAPSENPWISQELEQERAAMFQAHDVGQRGSFRNSLLQRRRDHQNPVSDLVTGAALQSDAMLYENLAAAWNRSGGHFSASPQGLFQGSEGLQGLWDGVLQAYPSEENYARFDNSSEFHNTNSASVNLQFDQRGEATVSRWQRSMQSGEDDQVVETSETHPEDADMDITKSPPSMSVDTCRNATKSNTESAGSPNTSLSSESGGDDSDDEECARNSDPPSLRKGCDGKRKTPDASGEVEDKDASTTTELKKTTPSENNNRPKKKKNAKRSKEPRYAIKTRTDVDIMDDGFKWRKYGQKAVKNSPHPRNYYRCTTPQCPVRKRVERSSQDSGMVITTYEGTHTHHTPGLLHRPAPDRPLGLNPNLSPSPNLSLSPNPNPNNPFPPGLNLSTRNPLLPLPREFTTLAALHQMRSLQQILAQQHIPFPTALQHESLLRAQQLLGLHDPNIKQEQFHPFQPNNSGNPFLPRTSPYPSRHHHTFQSPTSSPGPSSRIPHISMKPQHHQTRDPSPGTRISTPATDADLVRQVLEAEDRNVDPPSETVESRQPVSNPKDDFVSQIRSSLRSQLVEMERRRAAMAQRGSPQGAPVPVDRPRWDGESRRQAPSSSEDALVDGLLKEMVKRGENGMS